MSRGATNNLKRSSLIAVFAGALVTVISLPLVAQQVPPSADAWVTSIVNNGISYADTNFGSANSMQVAPNTTSYVQFNLSSVPRGTNVSKAMLRLYVDAVTASGSFDVYEV